MKTKRIFSAILSSVVLMSTVTALAGRSSSKETKKQTAVTRLFWKCLLTALTE